MQRFLATMRNCVAGLVSAALWALLLTSLPVTPLPALGGSNGSDIAGSGTAAAPPCDAREVEVNRTDPSAGGETSCEAPARTPEEIAEARAYLVETASPGYTMTLQGADLSTDRPPPEFAVRLANAIRDARNNGLPCASIFSAYRPPAFGIGGFHDKFNSLHTYGLAVDMRGIGSPGSPEARLWHEIAARNGVVCPYGPRDRAEWNHCQPTSLKMIVARNPLRDTVTAAGPLDLESMFEAGNMVIESMASAADSPSRVAPTPVRVLEAAHGGTPKSEVAASRRVMRPSRSAS